MKVKEIRLENFKCFEKLDLKLNKLTLLTGANSSGKSSVIYGLLSALQSSEFPIQFSTNGKYVNMGDFEDISYLHNKRNSIKIGFTLSNKTKLSIDTFWKYDRQRKLPKLSKFIVHEDYYDLTFSENQENDFILDFVYYQEKDPGAKFNTLEMQRKINVFLSDLIKSPEENKKSEEYFKDLENKFRLNDKKIRFKVTSTEKLMDKIFQKGNYALIHIYPKLANIFSQLDNKTNYISSFRFHPLKIRNEISKADLRIGKYGDNYEDQILFWETNKDKAFKNLVTTLRNIGILIDIKTSRLSGGNYELKVKTHTNGVYSSLTDVGFGISQFLPIVVSDLQLDKNSTLVISQPEIHLHPQLQSAFGDYLFEQISKNKKNYIVETHSEYLLNRIRLLVVQGKLKPSDVSVYYFQKNGNKVQMFELDFTTEGEIKNAPDGFFETYMTDVMNIALGS